MYGLSCSHRVASLPPHKLQGPSGDAAHIGSQAWSQEVPCLGSAAHGQPSREEPVLEVSTFSFALQAWAWSLRAQAPFTLIHQANCCLLTKPGNQVQQIYKTDLSLNRNCFHPLFQRAEIKAAERKYRIQTPVTTPGVCIGPGAWGFMLGRCCHGKG